MGYQLNPYKYVAKCDLFVCASLAEGFSTATTEALILGIPVCTVEVSGMKEMLGEGNEYGLVVRNDDEALYEGNQEIFCGTRIIRILYKAVRNKRERFGKKKTVQAVEKMLLQLCEG